MPSPDQWKWLERLESEFKKGLYVPDEEVVLAKELRIAWEHQERVEALIEKWRDSSSVAFSNEESETLCHCADDLEQALRGKEKHEEG